LIFLLSASSKMGKDKTFHSLEVYCATPEIKITLFKTKHLNFS